MIFMIYENLKINVYFRNSFRFNGHLILNHLNLIRFFRILDQFLIIDIIFYQSIIINLFIMIYHDYALLNLKNFSLNHY